MLFRSNGVLKNLSETNQITFGFGDDDFRGAGDALPTSSGKNESSKKSSAKQDEVGETASQLTFF